MIIPKKILLAAGSNPFGSIEPPVAAPIYKDEPVRQVSKLLTKGIQYAILAGALAALAYLLWGALDWITSDGEKEKILKAQRKMMYATAGIIVMVVALSVFGVLAGNVLGIITFENGGFVFSLPTFQ